MTIDTKRIARLLDPHDPCDDPLCAVHHAHTAMQPNVEKEITMSTWGNLADTERTEAAMDTFSTRMRNPAQQCPYCNAVISVKPTNSSEAAFHAAMDSMCAKFEAHMKKEHPDDSR